MLQAEMDRDNSGEIDFSEFYEWWKSFSQASPGLFKRLFSK